MDKDIAEPGIPAQGVVGPYPDLFAAIYGAQPFVARPLVLNSTGVAGQG
ncbi:hypothetical protein Y88_0855 [Novosphingobium nitrogenifigens DSM 19370]|uniref:Uncharacterized protein n=1 Tax=Novosphingobium nitrogenifigens DSM 19370 TaxID=983920 RepID=F1Z9E5_9SPHN|nr:hypothetical protein Y88_0855 [Novosphingobium nitrogenifigens DSM 19370]